MAAEEVSGPGASALGADGPPGETLYLNNLDERVPLAQLRAELRALCAAHGDVLDVVARKSLRKRGQAFVVFESAAGAARALPHLHDRAWHAKRMRAAYARTQSDAHVSAEKLRVRQQRRRAARAARGASAGADTAGDSAVGAPPAARVPEPAARGEPHNVLFLEQIPDAVTPDTLAEAFRAEPGFREARMFAIKHLGFVEFETADAAAAALDRWARDADAPDMGRMVFAKK